MAVFRTQSLSTSTRAGNNSNSLGTNWEQDLQPRDERIEELEEELERLKLSRKWFMFVLFLLYAGLFASFSLNVTLLMQKPTEEHIPTPYGEPGMSSNQRSRPDENHTSKPNTLTNMSHSTGCVVSAVCSPGSIFSCSLASCSPCPPGSYQPMPGQTSCWPCPPTTTTDRPGATSPVQCKRHDCPYNAISSVGVMKSPNYPGQFPSDADCRWRLSPGPDRRVILILAQLKLPPGCSTTFTISRADEEMSDPIFSTCTSTTQPTLLISESHNLWVQFKSSGNITAQGFHLTAISAQEGIGYLVDAILSNSSMKRGEEDRQESLSTEDKLLLSRLVKIINTSDEQDSSRNTRPRVEVLGTAEQARYRASSNYSKRMGEI